jgi:predicted homoserine dehydrogenase-like protein
MLRFTLLNKILLLVAIVGSLAQETEEPAVDCESLMTKFPDCTDMTFLVCTGSDPKCAEVASPQQVIEGGNNSTVTCEKYLCFDNGTYTSLEDDAVGNSTSMEDDTAGGAENGTSIEDDSMNGTSLEDDTKGTSSGPSLSIGTAVAAATVWAVAAGLSLVM